MISLEWVHVCHDSLGHNGKIYPNLLSQIKKIHVIFIPVFQVKQSKDIVTYVVLMICNIKPRKEEKTHMAHTVHF